LVARTLERQWEQALQQQRQLEEEHDRVLRQTPPALSSADRERIRALASDLPALWSAPVTTAQDRKAVVRCLIDRVVIDVRGDTEYVDVTIHWVGGFVSRHEVIRPVSEYGQLRDYELLVRRIRELHAAGYTSVQITEQVNREGFRSPRKRAAYDKVVIRGLMKRLGLPGETPKAVALEPDEWWERKLAQELRMPRETLHWWVLRGWVRFRRSRVHGFRILWADAEELGRLRRLRAYAETAKHRRRYPPELTVPKDDTASAGTAKSSRAKPQSDDPRRSR
jgi:hypothetical protein